MFNVRLSETYRSRAAKAHDGLHTEVAEAVGHFINIVGMERVVLVGTIDGKRELGPVALVQHRKIMGVRLTKVHVTLLEFLVDLNRVLAERTSAAGHAIGKEPLILTNGEATVSEAHHSITVRLQLHRPASHMHVVDVVASKTSQARLEGRQTFAIGLHDSTGVRVVTRVMHQEVHGNLVKLHSTMQRIPVTKHEDAIRIHFRAVKAKDASSRAD